MDLRAEMISLIRSEFDGLRSSRHEQSVLPPPAAVSTDTPRTFNLTPNLNPGVTATNLGPVSDGFLTPSASDLRSAGGPMVPLAAVLNMIGQSERQSITAMMHMQNFQSAQTMADSQRIAAMYLASRF
jgi:hypothetical protein